MSALRQWDIALAVICCLLIGALAYEIWAPMGDFDVPAVTVPERPPLPAITPFNPPPQSSFAAIDAKPIFNPARKPVESTAVPGSPTTVTPPEAVLIGVIMDGETQLALVKREGAPFAESLALGAVLDGWEVTEIAADHVLLRSGTQELALSMDGKRKNQPVQTRSPTRPAVTPPNPVMPMPFSRPKPELPQSRYQSGQDNGDNSQQQPPAGAP